MKKYKVVAKPGTTHNTRSGHSRYWVSVGYIEHWRYYLGKLYHWYDMRVPGRIPGWGQVEKFCRRLGGEIRVLGFDDEPERWRDRPIGWVIKQDLRCHDLNYAAVHFVGKFEIDEDTYRQMLK